MDVLLRTQCSLAQGSSFGIKYDDSVIPGVTHNDVAPASGGDTNREVQVVIFAVCLELQNEICTHSACKRDS